MVEKLKGKRLLIMGGMRISCEIEHQGEGRSKDPPVGKDCGEDQKNGQDPFYRFRQGACVDHQKQKTDPQSIDHVQAREGDDSVFCKGEIVGHLGKQGKQEEPEQVAPHRLRQKDPLREKITHDRCGKISDSGQQITDKGAFRQEDA